jgi:hypothetical protein
MIEHTEEFDRYCITYHFGILETVHECSPNGAIPAMRVCVDSPLCLE